MKKFRLICAALKVKGAQSYTVEAKNEEEALKRHFAGDSDFESEELEVQELGDPEVEEIE